MSVKSELRKELKEKRRQISNKIDRDNAIVNSLINLDEFIKADTVLFYAALDDEINTDSAIEYALSHGKKVALPVCIDSNGHMRFYYIDSLDNIKKGSFGVREPEIKEDNEVTDFTSSICIVPAISFDKRGYRLGYGKGYYDRFLEKYNSASVGLCYNDLVLQKLPTDKYDLSVNILITDTEIFYISEA